MKPSNGLYSQQHDLELDIAKKYIKNFRDKFPPNNKEGFPYSEAFNKAAIVKLLDHNECTGIRIFSGLKTDNGAHEVVFVLMGIDKEGKNILDTTSSLNLKASTENSLNNDSPAQENGQRNPPYDDGTENFS